MLNNRAKKGSTLAAVLATGMLGAGSVLATTVELQYSNNATGQISGDPLLVTNDIPDGTTYATVTIADDADIAGQINFTVTLSSYWDGICSSSGNCGIDSFGFNLTGGATSLADTDISGGTLPGNWVKTVGSTSQDGFGMFDAVVTNLGVGGQPVRVNPSLTFSINLNGDSVADYFADSVAGDNGSYQFAVHIAGFTDQNGDPILNPDDPGYDMDSGSCDTLDANNPNCNYLTSVWVAGPGGEGSRPPAAIPVPAAVWLFGSGLLGLVGVARRRCTA